VVSTILSAQEVTSGEPIVTWEFHWQWWSRQPEIIATDAQHRHALEAEVAHRLWQIQKLRNRVQRQQEKRERPLSRRELQALRLVAGISPAAFMQHCDRRAM
jgi:hypothetical protein